jgi:hypothetical protein
MSTPTEVARLGRLLTRRLEESEFSAADGVSVDDLHRRLLPYHLCRSELGLTTKAEYDILMLELIAESGYLRTDEPLLATAVRQERASPEPGLAFLQRFAASRLQLLDNLAEAMTEALPEPTQDARAPARPRSAASPPARARPTHSRRPSGGQSRTRAAPRRTTTACWSCSNALPDRRGLRYCPHCGVDQTCRPCGGCDAELDHGWAFCPICGEPAGRR